MNAHATPNRFGRATAVAAALAALLSGCGTAPIARSVVVANQAQEEAANRLLLLNIARAHEHMPMHFSQIGQIRSGMGGLGAGFPSLSVEIPFGGAAEAKFPLTAGWDNQTPADVTPLNNQEFVRGMTQPLEPDLLAFFAQQGWSPAMLMYLFFESIDLVKDDAVVDRLINDPLNTEFSRFQDFVAASARCDLVVGRDVSRKFFSSTLAEISARDGSEAKKAGLELLAVDKSGTPDKNAKANSPVRLVSVSKDAIIRLLDKPSPGNKANAQCAYGPQYANSRIVAVPESAATSTKSEGSTGTRAPDKTTSEVPSQVTTMHLGTARHSQRDSAGVQSATEKKSDASGYEVQFVLRSPQSMLYYLGELSRFQNANWYKGKVARPVKIPLASGREAVLFQMSNRGDIVSAAVSVEYGGQTFAVPKFNGDPSSGNEDRSVSVLSLMTLIIGLQDKGTAAPSVNNVRLLR